jgi:hypothetical protein
VCVCVCVCGGGGLITVGCLCFTFALECHSYNSAVGYTETKICLMCALKIVNRNFEVYCYNQDLQHCIFFVSHEYFFNVCLSVCRWIFCLVEIPTPYIQNAKVGEYSPLLVFTTLCSG